MSALDGNSKGNLLISYLFKSQDFISQVKEEREIKNEIAKLLDERGYRFVIADDELIREDIIKNRTI